MIKISGPDLNSTAVNCVILHEIPRVAREAKHTNLTII